MPDSQDPSRQHTVSQPEDETSELDRRLFHLKTLYDISRVLLGETNTRSLLKNFLFMTLGNFGVVEGFVYLRDAASDNGAYLEAAGIGDGQRAALLKAVEKWDLNSGPGMPEDSQAAAAGPALPFAPACTCQIHVEEDIGGILGLGPKLTEEPYSIDDRELLATLINNLTIALRNARSAQALESANAELSALNQAKDRAIDHLSHELKTPLTVLKGAFTMLRRQLTAVPESAWQRTITRAERNLKRLFEIEDEVEDIMKDKVQAHYFAVTHLFEQCAEGIEALLAETVGEIPAVETLRRRIDTVYQPRMVVAEDIWLDHFVQDLIAGQRPLFAHRRLDLRLKTGKVPPILIPPDPLESIVAGLVRNAVENTPEGGRIEVAMGAVNGRVELSVRDYGIGIPAAYHQRIFEGFVPVQAANVYSSGRPFDFNAGGKGADLLRMKIFSERYGFALSLASTRCRHIPGPADTCCGDAAECRFCDTPADCRLTGQTTFTVSFLSATEKAAQSL